MVLKRYKELGGEMVTIGSDAHSPEFVGLNFKETAEIIKNSGFDYLTYFKNRTPVLYKI
jgi:histidinol-phosphatase (PHP family)